MNKENRISNLLLDEKNELRSRDLHRTEFFDLRDYYVAMILLKYVVKQKIRPGVIFLTRGRKPLNRRTIWAQMKVLCKTASVKKSTS